MENKKIVVAGHISLDITPVFHNSGRQSIHDLLKPGKLVGVDEARISTGGVVSNTGLALNKLGANVLLMAQVAEDYFGRILKQKIAESGCESDIGTVKEGITSYTIVIAPKGIDRIFLHNSGCNETFGCADINFGKVAGAAHFHFGYPTLMRNFYQNDGDELVKLFKTVKAQGVTTSLDLAAVDGDSEASRCDWKKILSRTLPYVDFFVPSIEELGFLINKPLYQKWQGGGAGDDITLRLSLKEDVGFMADQAIGLGAKAVLLKCGAAGIFLKTIPRDKMERIAPELSEWGGITHFEHSFVPDRIRSATGAGDTSIAAFIKAYTDNYSPIECVRLAAATGASSLTEYDAVSGLLSFAELQDKIKHGWKKQSVINP